MLLVHPVQLRFVENPGEGRETQDFRDCRSEGRRGLAILRCQSPKRAHGPNLCRLASPR